MAVSKEALRAQLEGAMEDVALAMSESVAFQERLKEESKGSSVHRSNG